MKSLPFRIMMAQPRELTSSPRYSWDNQRRHGRQYYVMQYTYRGKGAFWAAREGEKVVSPNTAMLMRWGEASRYWYPAQYRETWEYGWINFFSNCDMFREVRRRHGSVVPLAKDGEAARLFRHVTERFAKREFRDELESSDLLYRVLLAVNRELDSGLNQEEDDALGDAIRYLNSNFHQPLTVKELAARCDLSREHFTRLFSERVGEQPGARLRRLRLQAAKQFLELTQLPLEKVARESGFTGAGHLCRVFQQQVGCSPQTYRRRQGGMPQTKASSVDTSLC